jgi:signal transduction histidine kinase
MTPAAEKWLGTTSRFPHGWTAKLVLLVITVGLVALDTTGGDFDLTRAKDWFDLVLPWTPMFAFLIGPRVAVVTWFVMFAVIVALGAVPVQVAGTVLPTMLLLGLSAYVLVWRAAVIFTAGVLVMLALAVVLNPAGLGLPGVITFATFMVLAAAAGLGLSLLRSRLERSARRVAELRVQQARVRAEERTRLAYELHDIVANQVTLIAMQARRAEFADREKTAQILENIGNSAGQTLQDLRSLVLLLKSEDDEDALPGADADDDARSTGGLVQDFNAVVSELEQAGFSVDVELAGPIDEASASLRQTLGRTLRELGTNILKHADPSGVVELHLAFTSDDVTLTATNQISAATPIFSTGTGLEAMRARCEVFGGQLAAFGEGGRWTTSISFPSARPLALVPPEGPS